MPSSFFTVAKCILLVLFIQHTEGFQKIITVTEVFDDDSVNDKHIVRSRGIGNDSGTDILTDLCCVHGNCSCLSLHAALINLTNDAVVNITNNVTLTSVVTVAGLTNIQIYGHNNATVYCNTHGGLYFVSCYNCTIKGIAWKGCGSRDISGHTDTVHPVLQLYNPSNVVIKNCSFQNSIGQALVLTGPSENVNISYCTFLYNDNYSSHGTAIHYSTNVSYQDALGVTIANCNFSYNSSTSVVYFGPTSLYNPDCYLYYSSFYFNKGSPVYLSNQNLEIYGNNEFYGNVAENGGAIFLSVIIPDLYFTKVL